MKVTYLSVKLLLFAASSASADAREFARSRQATSKNEASRVLVESEIADPSLNNEGRGFKAYELVEFGGDETNTEFEWAPKVVEAPLTDQVPTESPTFSPTLTPTSSPMLATVEVDEVTPLALNDALQQSQVHIDVGADIGQEVPSEIDANLAEQVQMESPTYYPSNIPTNTPTYVPSRAPIVANKIVSTNQPVLVTPEVTHFVSDETGEQLHNTVAEKVDASAHAEEPPTISPSFSPTWSPTLTPMAAIVEIVEVEPPLPEPTKESPTISPSFSPSWSPTLTPMAAPVETAKLQHPVSDGKVKGQNKTEIELVPANHSWSTLLDSLATQEPTYSPSYIPTNTLPTNSPTYTPTQTPPAANSNAPPTHEPTQNPSKKPTMHPLIKPTISVPANSPSVSPTTSPPSSAVTDEPSINLTPVPPTPSPFEIESVLSNVVANPTTPPTATASGTHSSLSTSSLPTTSKVDVIATLSTQSDVLSNSPTPSSIANSTSDPDGPTEFTYNDTPLTNENLTSVDLPTMYLSLRTASETGEIDLLELNELFSDYLLEYLQLELPYKYQVRGMNLFTDYLAANETILECIVTGALDVVNADYVDFQELDEIIVSALTALFREQHTEVVTSFLVSLQYAKDKALGMTRDVEISLAKPIEKQSPAVNALVQEEAESDESVTERVYFFISCAGFGAVILLVGYLIHSTRSKAKRKAAASKASSRSSKATYPKKHRNHSPDNNRSDDSYDNNISVVDYLVEACSSLMSMNGDNKSNGSVNTQDLQGDCGWASVCSGPVSSKPKRRPYPYPVSVASAPANGKGNQASDISLTTSPAPSTKSTASIRREE